MPPCPGSPVVCAEHRTVRVTHVVHMPIPMSVHMSMHMPTTMCINISAPMSLHMSIRISMHMFIPYCDPVPRLLLGRVVAA